MKKWVLVFGFLFLIALLTNKLGFASGLSKPVIVGPKAIGMGGAFVGIADDPTAIFHNPSGITQMKGHHFYGGVDGLITDLDYTPPAGTAESAKTEYLPVPAFGYTTDIFSPISLGLGVFFPHGNGGKFETASAVVTNPLEGRIFSLEIAPAVAVEIIEGLSVGATLRVVRVASELKGQVLQLGAAVDVLNNLDVSGWGVGASAGVLYKPCKYFSLGANYRSKLNADLDGDAQFATSGNFGATVDQTLPTLVTAGVGLKPIDNLTVGISYGWERNSEIDQFKGDLKTGGTTVSTITIPQNWTDSHTFHIGGEYSVTEALAVRTGYAKDLVDSIPDTVMNRVIGDIAAHEISFGGSYKWHRYEFQITWNGRFGKRDVPVVGTTNVAPGNYDAFVNSVSFGVGINI